MNKDKFVYIEVCKQCNIPLKMINKSACQNPKCGEIDRVLVEVVKSESKSKI